MNPPPPVLKQERGGEAGDILSQQKNGGVTQQGCHTDPTTTPRGSPRGKEFKPTLKPSGGGINHPEKAKSIDLGTALKLGSIANIYVTYRYINIHLLLTYCKRRGLSTI
jgi:hypothetical protein